MSVDYSQLLEEQIAQLQDEIISNAKNSDDEIKKELEIEEQVELDDQSDSFSFGSLLEELTGESSGNKKEPVKVTKQDPKTHIQKPKRILSVSDLAENLQMKYDSEIKDLGNKNKISSDEVINKVSNQISFNSKAEIKEDHLITNDMMITEKLKSLQMQINSVSSSVSGIKESTLVSGIGQGGDGQTPGSGEVKLSRMDDVRSENVKPGDGLIWNGTEWVPGEAGGRPPIYDGTDNEPILHPDYDVDSDEAQLRNFDVWINSEGALHYYYNDKWNSVTVYTENVLPDDDPNGRKLIVAPNGETFVNQKEFNEWLYTRTDRRPIIDDTPPTIHPDFPSDPLRAGDLWIDSNDSKLYYYEGNVWEPIAGSSGRNPIFANVEPILHPDYDPDTEDAELVVGDIWYDSDDNFKQYIFDGTDWIHPQDNHREAFTRFYEVVDEALYNSGNNATMSLGVADKASLDTVTSIKLSGTDGTDKVRYIFKHNDKLVIEDIRNGAYASYRVTSVVSSGEYTLAYENGNGVTSAEFGVTFSVGNVPSDNIAVSDTAPTQARNGTLWFDSSEDSLTLFMYYDPNEDPTEAAWIPAAPPVSLDGINATIKSALVVQSSILDRLNSGETTQSSIQDQVDLRLPLSGGVLTGGLSFERGDKDYNQFKISPNGGTDYNTNIYSLYGGQMRLRTSHTENEGDYNTHIILNPDENNPETKIYNVVTPTQDHMATNKEYVDDAVAGVGGSVPVGTVVMWFGTNAPSGWLKCDGSSFNTTTYSALHTHLGSVPNYSSGVLPNFQGLYPGGAGSGYDNALTSGGQAKTNTYHAPKTGEPSSGSPYENRDRPTNSKSGFNAAGGTNALIDAGKSKVTIDTGWDTVTRPPTLSIHFIIKAN